MAKKPVPQTKPLPAPRPQPWYEKHMLRLGIGAIIGAVFLIAPVFHIAESWASWWLSAPSLNIMCQGSNYGSMPISGSENAWVPAFITTLIVCGGLFILGIAAISIAVED